MDLIIDGNAFINVAISVTKNLTLKDKRTGEAYYVNDLFNDGSFILKEHVRLSFRNFCFTYFNSLIAPIGNNLGRVHFVFDSKSWRKEYISSFFESADFKTTSAPTEFSYKGKRKYDEFQYLFFDYFQQIIIPALNEKCGVNYYRLKGTEGDDIIAYLCEVLDEDILIYSVDQDLKQLVGRSDKNVLLIVPKQMSKTKKLFLSDRVIPTTDELNDFFSLNETHIGGSTIEKVVKYLKNKDYIEYCIDPTEEVLSKVLLGDKSDNIPKLISLTPSKSKKIFSVITEKFKDSILDRLDDLDEDLINELVNEIIKVNKLKDFDKIEETREHLLFNIKIIRLSPKVFPDDIRESLERFFLSREILTFNNKEFIQLKNNQIEL
jgi:5'-3' exonuclease